ncbi:MAG TPA: thioredoxin domain-containing protein [Gemmatimonadaceae bacterium]|jgi:protein-disulfide isomerase|nr:thioredoxin domain-containing protein [Gemmatimonadaceae bacterium]
MTAPEIDARPVLHPPVGPEDHSQGPENAPITLVEYGDFQCPHCYRAHPIVQSLMKRFGKRLRFVFRNFPLSELHPHALAAAEAAESVAAHAGEVAYWKMHDAIYQHQQESDDALDEAHLIQYAAEAGADAKQVHADLTRRMHVERVRADFVSGVRSGVNGTPTFFINGVRYDGDWSDATAFAQALDLVPSSR